MGVTKDLEGSFYDEERKKILFERTFVNELFCLYAFLLVDKLQKPFLTFLTGTF